MLSTNKIEVVDTDPRLDKLTAGMIWFNSNEHVFKSFNPSSSTLDIFLTTEGIDERIATAIAMDTSSKRTDYFVNFVDSTIVEVVFDPIFSHFICQVFDDTGSVIIAPIRKTQPDKFIVEFSSITTGTLSIRLFS